MRFIAVRDLRSKSAQVWRELSKVKDMVITSNGKPIALLSAISEETLEESLASIRQARAVAAVKAAQLRSLQKGTDKLTLDQINAEIAAVRRARRR